MELTAMFSNSDYYDYQKYLLLIILGPISGDASFGQLSLRLSVLGAPGAFTVL